MTWIAGGIQRNAFAVFEDFVKEMFGVGFQRSRTIFFA